MRVAVFGGSFNPPHVGHAMVSSWILWTGLAEQVWLMPTYSHALAKELPSFDQRVGWCTRMAGDVDPRIRVSRIEETLATPSYSIDSLRALQERYPTHEFRFVVGADILSQTDQWKQWAEIETCFQPIVVGRHGYSSPIGSVVFPEVSSTLIREHIREQKDFAHLVTASVYSALLQ